LLPKGSNANSHLAAANGLDNVNVKPLVKHVLSKESQELFAKLSSALTDETNIEWQNAALAAIRTEPGIHQLTTYLLSFIAEKVTHNMKNLFVLHQMMQATQALLDNQAIYLDPYMAYMVPPILTCCTGRHLGPTTQQASSNASSETLNGNGTNGPSASHLDHFELRTYAASLLSRICQKGSASNQGLKARIARTCLKQFMDPDKSPGTHYGALRALMSITHSEGVQMLILPNLKVYNDDVLKVKLAEENSRNDTEKVVSLLLRALESVAASSRLPMANGTTNLEDLRERLIEKVGDILTDRVIARQRNDVADFLLKANTSI
jgi:transcription initiation factor TFIID subunit 6